MARIYITRDSSFMGMSGVLHCFVNGDLIAKVKNGGDAKYDIDAGIVEFHCNIPMGPLSDIYTLRLTDNKVLVITVKIGALKPQITIMDPNAIISVRTVNGHDSSKAVTKNTNAPSLYSNTLNNKTFNPTKTVAGYFAMDDNTKQWAIAKGLFPSLKNTVPYNYSDIVDFELLEDGSSISKGGLGRAFVGAAFFGVTGAVVGSVTGKKKTKQTCTSLMIKITVRNTSQPVEYIKFISASTPKDGFVYKNAYKCAQEIISLLQIIVEQTEKTTATYIPSTTQPTSAVDEIRKYKALLDEGIISQDEFESKKKQLLGL